MTKGIDPLFQPPRHPKSWAEVIPEIVPQMVSAAEYVRAFQRNCPGVRMTDAEREELQRLFEVANQR